MKIKIITMIQTFAFFLITSVHSCSHDHISIVPQRLSHFVAKKPNNKPPSFKDRILQSTDWQPIRIYVDYSGIANVTNDQAAFLSSNLIPAVVNRLRSTFKVKPLAEALTIQETKCYLANIPSSFQETGAQADLVLFITTAKTESGKKAWGTACYLSPYDDRPVAGQLNINPTSISTKTSDWDSQFREILHEVIHVLGFSDSLFVFFKSNSGANLPIDQVVRTTNIRGVSTSIIVLPQVVQKAREYFGCESLEGLELENEGSSASKGSHWERRILSNDVMTASSKVGMSLSPFTLALLEGSGWYLPDYSQAEELAWGKDKGCAFLNEACIGTGAQSKFAEFCTNFDEDDCSYDLNYKGRCMVQSGNTTILREFNYFNNSIRSLDFFADNCPYITEYAGDDCRVDRNNAKMGLYAEKRGTKSKCFKGNFVKREYEDLFSTEMHTGCHEYKCTQATSGKWQLNIMIENEVVQCPENGGSVEVNGKYIGSVVCPGAKFVCQTLASKSCPNSCSGNGLCSNGVCRCFKDWYGEDCSMSYCPKFCSDHGKCDSLLGRCICDDGWGGSDCSEPTLSAFCNRCGGNMDCFGDECLCYDFPNRDCTDDGIIDVSVPLILCVTLVAIILVSLLIILCSIRVHRIRIVKIAREKKEFSIASVNSK